MFGFLETCCTYLPQRWIFATMGFFGLFNAYAMRACLSITLVEMVVPTHHDTFHDDTCPAPDNFSTSALNKTLDNDYRDRYHWSEDLQGLILGSFYWGYVITHLPGAIMAQKFGGKYIMAFGILITAALTLLTPHAIDLGGATLLIILRFLMGLGEGTTYPAINSMMSQWTPPEERSKIGSFVYAGAPLGSVCATILSGYILSPALNLGWRTVFYFFGSINLIWFIVWVFACYNNPREHPYISKQEYDFLNDRLSEHTHKKPPPVPWLHILKSKALWASIIGLIGHNWAFMTLVSDLPKYMGSVLKFPIDKNGKLSSLAYLAMWVGSLITSWIADLIIKRNYWTITKVRKVGSVIALTGPAIFIVAASYAGCRDATVVAFFIIGMTLMGTALPGVMVNVLDLSPNYAGTLMALANGISAISGIIAPQIVGYFTHHQYLGEWRLVFWIVFAVSIVSNIVFLVYGSGNVEYWNDPEFLERTKKVKQPKSDGNIDENNV